MVALEAEDSEINGLQALLQEQFTEVEGLHPSSLMAVVHAKHRPDEAAYIPVPRDRPCIQVHLGDTRYLDEKD